MDDAKVAAMLGNAIGTGGGLAVVLLILWRVLSKMFERWMAAMDRIATSVDVHTKTDMEHHASVKEAVIRLDAKVDAALQREHTPEQLAVPRAPSPASERRRFRTVPNRKQED